MITNNIRNSSPDNNSLLGSGGEAMNPPVFTRQQLSYKVGNSTLRVQTKFVTAVALVGCGALLLLYVMVPSSRTTAHHLHTGSNNPFVNVLSPGIRQYEEEFPSNTIRSRNSGTAFQYQQLFGIHTYNNSYPLSPPIVIQKKNTIRYRICVVTDLDTDSKDASSSDTWISYLKFGYLDITKDLRKVQIYWDEGLIKLNTKLSYGGRGLELSELVVFNGKLYSVDDRTGVVYQLDLNTHTPVPWVVLNDGNGKNQKGFKSEWATVKDGLLYVGGLGKEWTSPTGELINHNPQWIKVISPEGLIKSMDWTDNYLKLRESVGIRFPGYMIHESACWSAKTSEWIFLPRRASKERYDESIDEHKGVDLMLTASQDFSKVSVTHVGDLIDTHGFSSCKFIPGTGDQLIVALKSEEVHGTTATYVMVFTRQGEVLLKETKIGDYKYEGIEFV